MEYDRPYQIFTHFLQPFSAFHHPFRSDLPPGCTVAGRAGVWPHSVMPPPYRRGTGDDVNG